MYHIVIEQTKDYSRRMDYNPLTKQFSETAFESLAHARNFPHPYGWIKESGTPPGRHLDVILLSTESYALGEEAPIKLVGCFLRQDGDHKLIGILSDRPESDLLELPEGELNDLKRLYPRVGEGEGWFGASEAEQIVKTYFERGPHDDTILCETR